MGRESGQSLWKRLEASEDIRVFSCSKPFFIRRKDPDAFFGGFQCLRRDWDSGVLSMAPLVSKGGSGGSAKACRLPILPVLPAPVSYS